MDGVVNSDYLIRLWFDGKFAELEDDGVYGLDASLAVRKAYGEQFSNSTELVFPELAERISRIVQETDCSILWSSTWRLHSKYKNIEAAKEMFDRRGLPGNALIGYTPFCRRCLRGDEIRMWLANNTYGHFDRVAVLDDVDEAGMGLPDNCRFFQTKSYSGLTERITKDIIRYLNGE